jgi:hypothetical protein
MSNDFIPRNDSLFLVWLKTLLAYVQTKLGLWNIPQAPVSELYTLTTAFETALTAAKPCILPAMGKYAREKGPWNEIQNTIIP